MPVAAAATLGACREEPSIPVENAPVAENVASQPPPPATLAPEQPLDRAELLLAAVRARSAAGAGIDDVEAQRPLDNRRFELRIRLGCRLTPQQSDAPAEAQLDVEARQINLRAGPDISLETPPVSAPGGDEVEAAEGFWIPHPWLLTPACVAGPSSIGEIGLVQFFTADESRTQRRGRRPYQATVDLGEGEALPSAGSWELVLQGRLRKRSDGRVIQCRSVNPDGIPACIISVQFEQVRIEDIRSGRELAKWGRG